MRQVLSAWSAPWSPACPKGSKRSRYYRCSGQKGFMLLTYVVGLAVLLEKQVTSVISSWVL